MSRLSTKQRKSRRRGQLTARVNPYTGCLHFSRLPVDNPIPSTNTWGPNTDGSTYSEDHGTIAGTRIPGVLPVINGRRNLYAEIRCHPRSLAAGHLINAGYVPDKP